MIIYSAIESLRNAKRNFERAREMNAGWEIMNMVANARYFSQEIVDALVASGEITADDVEQNPDLIAK